MRRIKQKWPDGWNILEFSEFANRESERFKPKKSDETYPCIELKHINQDTGTLNDYISSDERKSTKNKFYPGQILFGKLRPYLRKFWRADFEGVCSSEIWVLEGKKNCINDYLFHLIQTHRFDQIANVSSGTKMPRADWNFISDYPFAIPPVSEQKEIVSLLEIWDQAISILEDLVNKKNRHKKALMQQLLSGKKRFPEFENESWVEIELGNEFQRVTQKNENEEITNVLTISAQDGLVSQTEYYDKSVASKDLSRYIVLQKGDFAYNKSYSDGYPLGAIKRLEEYESGVLSPLYICFRIDSPKINSDFMTHFFENGGLDHDIYKIAREGARNHGLLNVNIKDFFKISFKIPQIEEQKRIAEVLNKAKKEIELLEQELEAVKKQKKGLMQKLLTGKVRVKEVEHA